MFVPTKALEHAAVATMRISNTVGAVDPLAMEQRSARRAIGRHTNAFASSFALTSCTFHSYHRPC